MTVLSENITVKTPGYIPCRRTSGGEEHIDDHNAIHARLNVLAESGGVPGPAGPEGPQGIPGDAGPAGAAGLDGAPGAAGTQGPQGPQGLQGDAGPAGSQGVQGLTGDAGPGGPQGIQGVQGPGGPPGADGLDGAAGAQGIQGVQGEVGPQGPAGADGVGGAGIMQIPWHSDGSANFTLTNATQAARIAFNQPTRMVKFAPLASFTQVRLMGVQVTTSASVNTPLLRLRYKTGAYSETVGNYLQMGAAEVQFTLTGTGARDSGWIDLVAGARADVQLALIELGGDGVADPALGHVLAYFQ